MSTLVFGVGMHGRAAYRMLKRKGVSVVGFLDNDRGKTGGSFAGHTVYHPEDLNGLKFDTVVLAGRNIGAISRQLVDEFGMSEGRLRLLTRSELKPPPEVISRRSKATDFLLRTAIRTFESLGGNYWMDASSLLALMRGTDLAEFSDVDVTVVCPQLLDRVWNSLLERKDRPFGLERFEVLKSKGPFEAGVIKKIVIRSSEPIEEIEPACVDIVLKLPYGDRYLMPYLDRFLYVPRRHFEGFDNATYNGLSLRVPLELEGYRTLKYGEDWRTPTEFWGADEYGNELRI